VSERGGRPDVGQRVGEKADVEGVQHGAVLREALYELNVRVGSLDLVSYKQKLQQFLSSYLALLCSPRS
jgi:hypothetical protein